MNTYEKLLRDHSLFSRLSARALNHLTAHATLVKIPKGGIVYKEGDPCDALHVLVSGRCQSHIVLPDGSEHILDVYAPGDTFGERALLTSDRYWTTVRVITDSMLLRLGEKDVMKVLDHNPALARHMAQRMNAQFLSIRGQMERPDQRTKLGKVTGLASISTEELGTAVADNLSSALSQITGEKVLLVEVCSGARRPSLAEWITKERHIGSSFHYAGDVRPSEQGLERLVIYASGDPAETEVVADFIGHVARHYRFVLAFTHADVPAPVVIEFLLQADVAYVLLRQHADDLYRANLLVRQIHAMPGGQMVQVLPIVCLEGEERANPNQTLAGQLGVDVHFFVSGLPKGEEAPHQHYQRYPRDRFSSHIRHLAREIGRRRVGLALSSGGAKALAHIGILRVLEENGIHVDVIAGASMGAYIGSLWASGLSSEKIEELAMNLEKPFALLRLIDFSFTPRRGFMKGERLKRLLEESIGHAHFSDMVRQLRVVATDLDTLDRVVFDSGEVASAIQASMAMPGVIVPIQMDGHTLIDGGVADPLPVDVLIEMGVDHIIAVNTIPNPEDMKAFITLGEEFARQHPRRRSLMPPFLDRYLNYFSRGNILDVFVRSMHAAETRVAEGSCRQADVVLRPISGDGKWHDFRNPGKYIALGREVAKNHLEEIRALLK